MSENVSRFILEKSGEFKLVINGKEKTDSIWYISDSIISGKFDINNTNKLILMPLSWNSDIIDKAELTIKNAPDSTLVKPLIIELDVLSNTFMKGSSRWAADKMGNFVSDVECTKTNN